MLIAALPVVKFPVPTWDVVKYEPDAHDIVVDRLLVGEFMLIWSWRDE